MRSLLFAFVLAGCHGFNPDDDQPAIESVELNITDRFQWESRAADVRVGMWSGMALNPLPPRTPLHAVIHSRRERDGYSVENVSFESLPGVFVSGNLFRPLTHIGRVPGILHPHGHFPEDGWTARTRPDQQVTCARLAQMGAVCLNWDMVGWGEMSQLDHGVPYAMALQLWNGMRAVDFMEILPEVDATRIAVTGASGGGTQALLLGALDPRIAAVAPVVMVSADWPGGCDCETGMPIRDDTGTNNAEIAALLAPRPALFVSDGADWTQTFPTGDFPYLQSIWNLYRAEPLVENVHLPNEGHDLGPSKRAALYDFFARTFGLRALPLDATQDPPEGLPLEPFDSLTVFDAAHPRSDQALTDADAIANELYASM
jgi:hypothetical protein